jgi:homoserine kinase type II
MDHIKTNDIGIIQEVLRHYEIGELSDYVQDKRGFVNTSYAIETIRNGRKQMYFLRRYKASIREEELIFEHSLINHLVRKGLSIVAQVRETKEEKTYVWQPQGDAAGAGAFYAIFDFLAGEDRYTWINPTCNVNEIMNAAEVLAHFHQAVSDFKPEGKRSEPRIIELLPIIARNVDLCRQNNKHTIFDTCLLEHLDMILEHIETTRRALSNPTFQQLPQLVIHCDYHPGNLKFSGKGSSEVNRVVGFFDFDWSKVDVRSFDVALAAFYFFIGWEGEQDGHLDLEKLCIFLKTYQDSLRGVPGLGPMTSLELELFPSLLQAANLYVLNWDIMDYYQKSVDSKEYLMYLLHGLRLIQWFANPNNLAELNQILSSIDGN